MSLLDFIDKSRERYRDQGPGVVPAIGADFLFSAIARMPVIPKFGTNIFERDWDVLLILDAARLDMYRRIINSESDGIWSVGSSSNEWMQNTFTNEFAAEIAETAYVTGNPFSDEECPTEMFARVDELWRDHWDDEVGTIRPDPITDYVIANHREGHDRVIGHYMQPHYPFIGAERVEGDEINWDVLGGKAHSPGLSLWDQFLYNKRTDIERVQAGYDANLSFVWEAVETVRQNVDGKLVVTADHGNAVGEWGMWGHKPGMPHPKMRLVPWDTYECRDQQTVIPDVEPDDETDSEVVEKRLEDLGYK